MKRRMEQEEKYPSEYFLSISHHYFIIASRKWDDRRMKWFFPPEKRRTLNPESHEMGWDYKNEHGWF